MSFTKSFLFVRVCKSIGSMEFYSKLQRIALPSLKKQFIRDSAQVEQIVVFYELQTITINQFIATLRDLFIHFFCQIFRFSTRYFSIEHTLFRRITNFKMINKRVNKITLK